MFWKKKNPVSAIDTQRPQAFAMSVGDEFPLSSERPPMDSATAMLLPTGVYFILQVAPPLDQEMMMLETINRIRGLYTDPETGWPVISFHFEGGAVYQNALMTRDADNLGWFDYEANGCFFVLVDRTTNIVQKQCILGLEPDYKSALGDALRKAHGPINGETAARLAQIDPSEALFGGRAWVWNDEGEQFVEIEEREQLDKLKAANQR